MHVKGKAIISKLFVLYIDLNLKVKLKKQSCELCLTTVHSQVEKWHIIHTKKGKHKILDIW